MRYRHNPALSRYAYHRPSPRCCRPLITQAQGKTIMQIELTLPLPPPEYLERMEREQQPETQNDSEMDPFVVDDVTFQM